MSYTWGPGSEWIFYLPHTREQAAGASRRSTSLGIENLVLTLALIAVGPLVTLCLSFPNFKVEEAALQDSRHF